VVPRSRIRQAVGETTLRAPYRMLRYLPGMRARPWIAAAIVAMALGPASANAGHEADTPKAWLGISYNSVSGVAGLPVNHVFKESAASAAGMRDGDEIISIDGVATEPGTDLRPLIGDRAIGDRVTIRVLRNNRVVVLRATLAQRINDAELLHRQLFGRQAPAFSLVDPADPDAAPTHDTVLTGKVGILVWAHTSCAGCLDIANTVAAWVDGRRDVIGLLGLGSDQSREPADRLLAAATILRHTPVLMPAGFDQDAWFEYGVTEDYTAKASVVVVDRDGVVQMAALVDPADADDAALDDVFAAAERALKPRKTRR
jgi:hypothetical protein